MLHIPYILYARTTQKSTYRPLQTQFLRLCFPWRTYTETSIKDKRSVYLSYTYGGAQRVGGAWRGCSRLERVVGLEPIALSKPVEQIAGLAGFGLQQTAQMADVQVEHRDAVIPSLSPHRLYQLPMGR